MASTCLAWLRALKMRGRLCRNDEYTQALGLSVDTEFSSLVRDSDFPLVWVAQKPCGGSPGLQSAGFESGMGLPVTALVNKCYYLKCVNCSFV